jgi:hypothetical protein
MTCYDTNDDQISAADRLAAQVQMMKSQVILYEYAYEYAR